MRIAGILNSVRCNPAKCNVSKELYADVRFPNMARRVHMNLSTVSKHPG
jgi:hypothetical protein